MIFALGNVSGAHFNPAVTVAIVLSGRGKCDFATAGIYVVVQILGGITASIIACFTFGRAHAFGPVGDSKWGQVAVAETVFTFVLCFVVLCVATTKEPSKDMFGLVIGSCVTVGGYAIGSISGGSLNPAVSFGIDCSSIMKNGMVNCLIFSVFEFVGAALAAGAFYVTRPTEFNKGSSSASD